MNDKYRVQKLLSNYGYCSRRKGEDLIKQGRVKVNNKTITIGDCATLNDKISVDNKIITAQEKIYLAFNKPAGYVCSLSDKHNKTIMDIIKIKQRVFPIGRLDNDTTGLLILTNDGDFANNVMHPRYEINKTYRVWLNKRILRFDVKRIERGVKIEDYKTSPAKVKVIKDKLVEVTIHEGKKHIIKKLFKALNYIVVDLERIKIGQLDLNKLKIGQYKSLSKEDLKKIFLK